MLQEFLGELLRRISPIKMVYTLVAFWTRILDWSIRYVPAAEAIKSHDFLGRRVVSGNLALAGRHVLHPLVFKLRFPCLSAPVISVSTRAHKNKLNGSDVVFQLHHGEAVEGGIAVATSPLDLARLVWARHPIRFIPFRSDLAHGRRSPLLRASRLAG